jgi:hypothetical protein
MQTWQLIVVSSVALLSAVAAHLKPSTVNVALAALLNGLAAYFIWLHVS